MNTFASPLVAFNGLDAHRLRAVAAYFHQHYIATRTLLESTEAMERRRAELAARLARWRNQRAPSRVVRDRRVMILARRGLTDIEIGRRLGISDRTVRRIIKRELRR